MRRPLIKKGFISFILFMIASVTASAGNDKIVVANVDKDLPFRQKPAVLPPVVTEKYEYYDVNGICEKDLQFQMRQKGITWTNGKKYNSTTSWHVKWDYGYNDASQACSPDSFRVVVEITFRYPKWVGTAEAPQPLVDKWNSYMQHLVLHENGHRDMAVEAATELVHAVAALPPAPDCAKLDRELRSLSRARMNKLNDDEKQYDTTTMHGYTQGAVFP
jgi:predicted secreted Zn-dependent protease